MSFCSDFITSFSYLTDATIKERYRRQLRSTNPAFYAYMSGSENKPGPHHTLIFDHLITNLGNNYNRFTGVFSANQAGLYVFSYTITPDAGAIMPVEIVKNSDIVGSLFVHAYSSYQSAASSTVIIQMNVGDVYIQVYPYIQHLCSYLVY